MKPTLALATMIALGAAAWTPLPSMAQNGFNLVINTAPPAPRFETVPAARHGYVWAPGYWNWDGRRHASSRPRRRAAATSGRQATGTGKAAATYG